MQKLWHWVLAVACWLGDGWRVWSSIVVVVVVCTLVSLLPGNTTDHLRYAGLGLQLLGITTIVVGLQDRRRLFDRPSLFEYTRRWLERRPRWNAATNVVALTATMTDSASAKDTISIWRSIPADATVEERLAALEANIDNLKTKQTQTSTDLHDEIKKRTEAGDVERKARESAIEALQTRVASLGVGDLHLETAGVFWLILGVILATIPQEIAHVLT